jgi:tRNA(His) 5'-end guanylyltransferase
MAMRYDDALGDMLKPYEAAEGERRVAADEVLMVRVDGMAFSTYTSNMKKPYDETMAACMKETCRRMLEYFSPSCVYVQSDEITLFYAPGTELKWNGRLQKNASACAGKASAFFAVEAIRRFPASEFERFAEIAPAFEGRAVSVPSQIAAMFLVWRELDARGNGTLGAGRSAFSQRELQGKSPSDIKEMLASIGLDYYRDFPVHMRRGTLMRKRKVAMTLTEAELARIPEHVRDSRRGIVFERTKIVEVEDRPPFYEIENIADFAFYDTEPVILEKPFASRIFS